jgi:hypothetical protein
MIDIGNILTNETAVLIISALLVSLVGSTLAIAIRHKTSENWKPGLEDVWYYILAGSVSAALALLGYGTPEILAATTGINTPIAVLKTGLERRNAGHTKLKDASLEDIQAEIAGRAS